MSSAAQMLLLGTFHMGSPGRDLANVAVDDVLTEHRQLEIAAVVDGLVRFAPTVVAGEWPADRQSDLDSAYREFRRAGSGSRSEIVQLGFRLAARAGLGRVVAVDVEDDFWVAGIDELTGRDPQAAHHLRELTAASESDAEQAERALAGSTLGEALRGLNTTESRRRTLAPYLEHLVPIALGGAYPGPEAVGNWYRRNFKIAANLMAAAEPGDRVVVIYGAGHMPVLDHVLSAIPSIQLIDPLEFLPRPSA